jgi:hypothetical protein
MKRTPFKPSTKQIKRTTALKTSSKSLSQRSTLKQTKPLARRTTLAAKTSIKSQTTSLVTKSTLKANPARIREAKAYHDAVFAHYGSSCRLCDRPHPASHAAHVIKRSTLGRLRYADVRFARPAHPDCHQKQEANQIFFSASIRRSAALAYNALTRNSPKLVPDA